MCNVCTSCRGTYIEERFLDSKRAVFTSGLVQDGGSHELKRSRRLQGPTLYKSRYLYPTDYVAMEQMKYAVCNTVLSSGQ